jgi:predicted PurR-regulated permease PerM
MSPLRDPRADPSRSILRWTLLGLWIAAIAALLPLWAPLLLASWLALVVKPVHNRLIGALGKGRAAGVLTVLLFVVVLAPLVMIGLSLVGATADLFQRLKQTGGLRQGLDALLASEPNLRLHQLDPRGTAEMLRQHGASAFNAASTFFGAATALLVGLVVFLFGLYTFLVDGGRIYRWLLDHSPLPRAHLARLADAYVETGRGLLISTGLTALIQGAIATIGYLAIGVPQALVLGLLSVFAALIPSVGTGLVWAPVTAALLLGGRTAAGVALLAIGLFVSVIDNFVRPWLSRYGHLELPMFLTFIAMLGGITAFGAWGLLAGPLFVRLAVEALRIWREEQTPHVRL